MKKIILIGLITLSFNLTASTNDPVQKIHEYRATAERLRVAMTNNTDGVISVRILDALIEVQESTRTECQKLNKETALEEMKHACVRWL